VERYDLLVVGAGVIGLAAAWQEAGRGARVALVDPHPGRGASYAAAGMLAPVTEAAFGEEGLVEFSLHSAAAWPAFAEAIERESGLPVGLVRSGTLLVGVDASDRDFLEQLQNFHARLGLESRFCLPSECRTHEPLLAAAISGGLFVPDDLQVDNRRLLAALAVAARRAGVEEVRARVLAIDDEKGAITGATTELGAISAARVLIAAGAATPELVGQQVAPVSAVKGQILRLRTPEQGPSLSRTVRAIVEGRSIYIVPRGDGRVVVGATVETRGEAGTTTVGGVYELLRDATAVLPALKEFELLEAFAAARPGTPDNAPLIGAAATPGLFLATGHYRHGFLFAPAT
jgi:glycine oxidase